jgi:hypothetical protein
MVSIWVTFPEVAVPVTAPIVSSPVLELVKSNAVLAEFNTRPEPMVLAPVDCWRMPENAPVPPMVMAWLEMFVVGPTFAAKVMLLALFDDPVRVMVPVFVAACEMNRSSAEVVTALRVPAPPVLSVFQKVLELFQPPTTVEKPGGHR